MKVTIEYTPQYEDFDNYLNPVGPATERKWVLGINPTDTSRSLHTKMLTKPTPRQVRKIKKAYMQRLRNEDAKRRIQSSR